MPEILLMLLDNALSFYYRTSEEVRINYNNRYEILSVAMPQIPQPKNVVATLSGTKFSPASDVLSSYSFCDTVSFKVFYSCFYKSFVWYFVSLLFALRLHFNLRFISKLIRNKCRRFKALSVESAGVL